MRAHLHPFCKNAEIELFVWRMGIVVRKRETEQECIHAEYFFEIIDDRNRTALAHEHRIATERGFERSQSRLRLRAIWSNKVGFAAVPFLNFDPDGWGADFPKILPHEFAYLSRSLIWHKAHGEFRAGPRGDDRLTAVALVTAREPVDFQSRPGTPLFHGRKTAFPK